MSSLAALAALANDAGSAGKGFTLVEVGSMAGLGFADAVAAAVVEPVGAGAGCGFFSSQAARAASPRSASGAMRWDMARGLVEMAARRKPSVPDDPPAQRRELSSHAFESVTRRFSRDWGSSSSTVTTPSRFLSSAGVARRRSAIERVS